jgi:O-antigen/teichoic acid export membrane protein
VVVQKSFFWFLFPTLLQTIIGMCVMVPVTTFYLDPEDIGIVAILTALTMLVTPLSTAGDSWVLSTHWHATSDAGRKALLFNLLLANVMMKAVWVLVFWFLSPTLLPYLVRDFRPEYQQYFALALLGVLAGACWPTFSALMVIERDSYNHAVNESLQWAVGALTTLIGLSVLNIGVLALFLSPILAGGASALHGIWLVSSKLSFHPSRYWAQRIIGSGLPTIPFSLMDVISNSLDRFIIQRWLSLSALGVYAHSQTYRGIFVTFTKAYSRTMTPEFLELFSRNHPQRQREVRDMVSIWYVCMTGAGVVVTLFATEVVHLLTHGKFDQAAALVPIWFLLIFAHTMGIPFTQYLLTAHRNLLLSWSSIAVSLGTMGAVCAATWLCGLVGATSAAVAGSVVLHITRYLLARRLGCPYGIEAGFVGGIALVLGMYLLTMAIPLPFTAKVLAGIMVAVVLYVRLAPYLSLQSLARDWAAPKSHPP